MVNERTQLIEQNGPLLLEDSTVSNNNVSISTDSEIDVETQIQKKDQKPFWLDELEQMIRLAVPVIGKSIFEMTPGVVSIALVGRISQGNEDGKDTEYALSAASLAVMLNNTMALAVGFGLNSALDTMCSMAYGAGESNRMGIYLQTSLMVSAVWTMIYALITFECERILLALGQDPIVSRMAATYSLCIFPGVPFVLAYDSLTKVLQAQNVAKPQLYVSMSCNVLYVVVGYVLVYHTSLGWRGAAVAKSLCDACFFFFLLPYVVSIRKTFWTGLDLRSAADGVHKYLILGVPGMLQTCFEWWAFDLLALLCGVLPNGAAVTAIAANAVMTNVSTICYMVYLGLSIACSVRVGNALGANDPRRAKSAAWLSLGLVVVAGTINATVFLVFRRNIPTLFTHDRRVNDLVANLFFVAAAFQISDGVNAIIRGIFQGSARQYLGARLNFVAYYCLGIPLAIFAAFRLHGGVIGLWLGMCVALTFIVLVGVCLVVKSDWSLLAKQAKTRIKEQGEET